MKRIFNLYFWNINQSIDRMQYWWFIITMISVAIIAGITQNILNIRETMDSIINILDMILLWPSLLLVAKRCNSIGCNLYVSILIGAFMVFAPPLEVDELIIAGFFLLGIIPSNYINNLVYSYQVYKKIFN